YFIRSEDGGKTWGNEIRISSVPGRSYYQDILVNSNGIHIIWEEQEEHKKVYYKRSDDDGISWTAGLELAEGDAPCILDDGNDIFVFYEARNTNSEPPYYSVFCKKSEDGGKTWGAADELFYGGNPCVTKDSIGRIHLGWNNGGLYCAYSDDFGQIWSTPKIISNSNSSAGYGCIISDDNAVYVVWAGWIPSTTTEKIYYNSSVDSGENWGETVRLTDSSGLSLSPSILSYGGAVHVVWSDGRNYLPSQLYYKRYDPTAPAGEPSSPQILGESNNYINTTRLTFYWTRGTVVDNESEVIGYNFQVGTYPNGTDVYDGGAPLLGRLTIIGENGKTYYARVQAVTETDRLSGWSDWSAGVTVKAQTETVTSIVIEPNPCSLSRDGRIYFKNLTAGARVDIYTVSGKILRKITDNDGDGVVEWDCKNKHGYRVNRGVYLYQASGGGKISGKFAVVK
ncbi:MAG: exo-alpha-sialidase, partial [Elusimicrobia bacterium]|nr:exo-alpha-sialidase [Elusimicrobiota bacterium]